MYCRLYRGDCPSYTTPLPVTDTHLLTPLLGNLFPQQLLVKWMQTHILHMPHLKSALQQLHNFSPAFSHVGNLTALCSDKLLKSFPSLIRSLSEHIEESTSTGYLHHHLHDDGRYPVEVVIRYPVEVGMGGTCGGGDGRYTVEVMMGGTLWRW